MTHHGKLALLLGLIIGVTTQIPERPDLIHTEENVQSVAAQDVSTEKLTAANLLHSRRLQQLLVQKIEKVQPNDLRTAQRMAAKLSDDAFHIQGYMALMPALVQSNPAEARRVYRSERTRLQEVRDRVDHLNAQVALAKGAYEVGDEDFSGLALAALEEGAALFNDDSAERPQLPPSRRKGYAPLADLAQFTTDHRIVTIQTRVQELHNHELKASLLVYGTKRSPEGMSTTVLRHSQ